MNLASLRYLVALHEHQHFGRAALACHITQPALSNALRALEAELGTAIVKRGRSYAGLTPEGALVLASARRMLHEREHLQQELDSGADAPQGRLQLAAVPTAMPILARFAALLQARHPGIVPVVRSLSSPEIEAGLDGLSLDLGLGYTDRLQAPAGGGGRLAALPQYTEHYFLLRRARRPGPSLQIGPPMPWADAAHLPLCLLTPEMHNRSIVDQAFAKAGATVRPAIETNSITALALAVLAGEVCSVMPGALVGTLQGEGALQARPLAAPEVLTPIGFVRMPAERPPRALRAALQLAGEPQWLAIAAAHSGRLARPVQAAPVRGRTSTRTA
ncbi:LysR family transcriptional regulator [Pseudorhodoferax sp. Leaf267]|uniref:LysR family transcriptional regulator n=1 Tax=Pseudorhodoferax sp. Leaf267 TaxID=1736316 RepID=UPI0006FF64F3|nr:LysR substrate-binding domain-containing protein [Pseudorhodoferax sp. Leaf267]KQP13292.1 LysR family transcriptional regulator [Pseudorhodoferax sp. Leaf267]